MRKSSERFLRNSWLLKFSKYTFPSVQKDPTIFIDRIDLKSASPSMPMSPIILELEYSSSTPKIVSHVLFSFFSYSTHFPRTHHLPQTHHIRWTFVLGLRRVRLKGE